MSDSIRGLGKIEPPKKSGAKALGRIIIGGGIFCFLLNGFFAYTTKGEFVNNGSSN